MMSAYYKQREPTNDQEQAQTSKDREKLEAIANDNKRRREFKRNQQRTTWTGIDWEWHAETPRAYKNKRPTKTGLDWQYQKTNYFGTDARYARALCSTNNIHHTNNKNNNNKHTNANTNTNSNTINVRDFQATSKTVSKPACLQRQFWGHLSRKIAIFGFLFAVVWNYFALDFAPVLKAILLRFRIAFTWYWFYIDLE